MTGFGEVSQQIDTAMLQVRVALLQSVGTAVNDFAQALDQEEKTLARYESLSRAEALDKGDVQGAIRAREVAADRLRDIQVVLDMSADVSEEMKDLMGKAEAFMNTAKASSPRPGFRPGRRR